MRQKRCGLEITFPSEVLASRYELELELELESKLGNRQKETSGCIFSIEARPARPGFLGCWIAVWLFIVVCFLFAAD